MQVIKTFISIHTWDWLYSHGIFRSLSCIKYSLFMPPCKKGLKHSWNAVVDKSNKYNVVKSIERIFHVLPCWKPCIVLCERIKIRPSFFSHEKRPRAPTKNPHALQRRSFFNNNNIKLPGRKPPGQGNFGTFQPLFCVLVSIFSGVGWSLYVLATIVGQAPLHAITKGNLYHLFVWTWGPNLDSLARSFRNEDPFGRRLLMHHWLMWCELNSSQSFFTKPTPARLPNSLFEHWIITLQDYSLGDGKLYRESQNDEHCSFLNKLFLHVFAAFVGSLLFMLQFFHVPTNCQGMIWGAHHTRPRLLN